MNGNGTSKAAPAAYGRGLSGDEHPRQRLLQNGPESLSNAELLAVLFRTGRPGSSALDSAQDLLRQIGGLIGLMNADESLQMLRGVGQGKASTLLAAVELGRRLAKARFHEREILDHPAVVADYLSLRYSKLDQEIMGALYLNARNHLIAEREVFRGTTTPRSFELCRNLRPSPGFIAISDSARTDYYQDRRQFFIDPARAPEITDQATDADQR